MELIIKHVDKSFKGVHAVKDVNVSLKPGVHALLGANGSGKSTLMKLVVGLLKGQGKIFLDEIDASFQYDEYVSQLGYLPQNFGYYPHYTVIEFLEYMGIVKGLSQDYTKQRIKSLLEAFHLEDKANEKMKTLSGGMLRRVGIIQAMLNEPHVLILDEPTVGLDPKERIIFMNLIASLSQTTIVLLSTHIVSDIESIADDILLMKDGEVIMYDNVENLLKVIEGKVWEVTLPRCDALPFMKNKHIVKSYNHNQDIYMRLIDDDKPIEYAKSVEPSLDDLYLYYFAKEDEYETINLE